MFTNTPVAVDIIDEIAPHLQKKTMIIDITTHKVDGSIKIFQKLNSLNISYVESPVMGGPVQAEEGVLGAIVGCEDKDFEFAKEILMNFCKDVFTLVLLVWVQKQNWLIIFFHSEQQLLLSKHLKLLIN